MLKGIDPFPDQRISPSRRLWRHFTRFNQRLIARLGPESRLFQQLAQLGVMPGWLSVRPVVAGGRPAEWLDSPESVATGIILYFHGGGWVMGYSPMNRRLAGSLGRAAGRRVLALQYRLAPRHPFPAALHDCQAAYEWLLIQGVSPAAIVLAGDSAGANLALALLLRLRDEGRPLPAGAICFSAVTDLTGRGPSFWRRDDPGLSASLLRRMADQYAGGADLRRPLLSPAFADLTGLPPLLLQVGEDEILFSDNLHFAARARAAGVDVRLQVWPGMWHAWHMLTPMLPEATAALAAAGEVARQWTAGFPRPGSGQVQSAPPPAHDRGWDGILPY